MKSILAWWRSFLVRLTPVKQAELIMMLKQLSALIASGMALVPSLHIMEEQVTNRKLRVTLRRMRQEIEQGKSLSEAFDGFPRIFPVTVRSTIRVGETSGLLETAMEQITQFMEEQSAIRGGVVTALIYPAIVFVATMGLLVFMVLVVIPQIIPFLEMMGGEMPWNTRLLIDVTEFAGKNARSGGLALVAAGLLIFVLQKTRLGRYRLDLLKTRMPLFGFLIHNSIIVQFAKTMHLLVSSGVPLVEALTSAREIDKNSVIRRAIDMCISGVLQGESLSEPMRKAAYIFPPLVRSMVKVGEETGTMDASLKRIGDIHYSLLQSYIKRLNATLEPVLLLFLGGMVGFVAAAMIGGIIAGYVIQ